MRSNRNTARSKAMLRKAYMELALLDVKITVSSVCKRAGLSRNTLYAHYVDLVSLENDVWNEFEQEIDRYAEQVVAQQQGKNPCFLLLLYAQLIQHDEIQWRSMARAQWFGVWMKKLEETFEQCMFLINDEMEHDAAFAMTVYIITGVMANLYTKYLQNKLDVPLQQINDRIMRLYDEEIGKLKDQPDSLDAVQTDCTDDV